MQCSAALITPSQAGHAWQMQQLIVKAHVSLIRQRRRHRAWATAVALALPLARLRAGVLAARAATQVHRHSCQIWAQAYTLYMNASGEQ